MAKIYLLGYMGSGKSTVGAQLASKLNYEFIDLDKLIVSEYGQTIPHIFAEIGRASCRERV